MPIKTYLFDLDDVLVDTKIYKETYNPILTMIEKRLNINRKELENRAKKKGLKKNKSGRWDSGDLCREFGLLEPYYNTLKKYIKVKRVINQTAIEVLKTLKKRKNKVGIVSNSMKRTISLYLNKYKLIKYLNFVYSSEDCGCKKSSEKYWQTLTKKKNLKPKECLVIGDDPLQDIKVPKRLGFNTFLIKKPSELKKVLKIS